MMIPFVGYFFSAFYISVISNFLLSPAYLLVAYFIGSLTGGWTILLMAMFSYVGDYTTDKVSARCNEILDTSKSKCACDIF